MTEREAEILAEVRRILATEMGREGPVELTHDLARDLGVDSVGALILAVGLEDRFLVKLDDSDAGSVVTVGNLVDLVDRCLAAEHPAGDGIGDT